MTPRDGVSGSLLGGIPGVGDLYQLFYDFGSIRRCYGERI